MSSSRTRQLAALSGIAFVILMSVALFLPGPPPKADDSIGKITAMLVEHRRAFLVGGYVAGLSVLCYLWFAGSVWRHLTTRTRDQTGLAIAACSGGLFAVTLTLLGMAMFSGVAFKAAALGGDPALVRALTDAGNTAIETAKFGLAAFLLASCRARAARRGLPRAPATMGRESTAGTAQHARELPSFRRPRARGERRRTGQLPNRPRRHDVLLGAPGARRRLHHGDLVAAGTCVLHWRGGRMPDSSSAVLVSGGGLAGAASRGSLFQKPLLHPSPLMANWRGFRYPLRRAPKPHDSDRVPSARLAPLDEVGRLRDRATSPQPDAPC